MQLLSRWRHKYSVHPTSPFSQNLLACTTLLPLRHHALLTSSTTYSWSIPLGCTFACSRYALLNSDGSAYHLAPINMEPLQYHWYSWPYLPWAMTYREIFLAIVSSISEQFWWTLWTVFSFDPPMEHKFCCTTAHYQVRVAFIALGDSRYGPKESS